MTRSTPEMRRFAERLIAHETAVQSSAAKSSDTTTPTAFLVCEKLRPHLSTLMGTVGFDALLSRALALAGTEAPGLRALQVAADGSLKGLAESEVQLGPADRFRGGAILLAHLLGLLVTFIGEDLTQHLVRGVWPKLPLDNPYFGKGAKNEKA